MKTSEKAGFIEASVNMNAAVMVMESTSTFRAAPSISCQRVGSKVRAQFNIR